MSALVYILRKSLKNSIKGLVRKPAALIAYIIIGCIFVLPSLLSGPNREPVTAGMSMDVAKSIFMGYTVFLFFISMVSSLSGASFFRMADVNMLFTAPLKAGYILVYGFIKQLGTNFMIMLFLALQYPNWKKTFGLTDGAGWILMVAYMLLVTVTSLLGMILYAYISKKPGRESIVKKIIYGSVIAFILPIAVNTITSGDILDSMVKWLSKDYLSVIPIIGWFREMLMGVYTGINSEVLIYSLLTLITILASFIYIYRMDTGFYENVISGTELKESALEATRKGKTFKSNANRRYRKVNAKFTLEGSLAIFQKQILEKRKKGFLLLPTRTIIMVIGAIIAAVSIPVDGKELMLGILAFAAYLMLIFTMATAWEGDISYHYIYLIPATPFKKMVASTLVEVINMFIEGILIFGIIGMILKTPFLVAFSAILAYTALGIVFIYSDLVVRRMFGKIHGNILRIFFRIFLLIIIILFSVIPAVIIFISTKNYTLALLTPTLINGILIIPFMWIGAGLFESPELP